MTDFLNNTDLLHWLHKWFVHLVLVAFAAVVLSVVFSSPYFVAPKYLSEAIVYPVNLTTYSEESSTEQMLQVISSFDIKKMMFDKFNLGEHYQIDSTNEHFITALSNEFDANVSFRKTEYESVRIRVLDTDAQVASNMVDSLIAFYNEKIRSLHRSKVGEVVELKYELMQQKLQAVDSLEQQQQHLRDKYGILDYYLQIEKLTEGYARIVAQRGSNHPAAIDLKQQMDRLREKGGEYEARKILLTHERDLYITLKKEYELALQEYNKQITYAQVVEYPFPADKKSYPTRWLIVLASVIAATVLAFVVITVLEKNVRKNAKQSQS